MGESKVWVEHWKLLPEWKQTQKSPQTASGPRTSAGPIACLFTVESAQVCLVRCWAGIQAAFLTEKTLWRRFLLWRFMRAPPPLHDAHAVPAPARTSGARAAAPIRRREGRRAARAADLTTTSRIRQLLHDLHQQPPPPPAPALPQRPRPSSPTLASPPLQPARPSASPPPTSNFRPFRAHAVHPSSTAYCQQGPMLLPAPSQLLCASHGLHLLMRARKAAPAPARTSGARAAAPIRCREGRRALELKISPPPREFACFFMSFMDNPLLPRPPRCRSGRDRTRPRLYRRRFSPRGRPPRLRPTSTFRPIRAHDVHPTSTATESRGSPTTSSFPGPRAAAAPETELAHARLAATSTRTAVRRRRPRLSYDAHQFSTAICCRWQQMRCSRCLLFGSPSPPCAPLAGTRLYLVRVHGAGRCRKAANCTTHGSCSRHCTCTDLPVGARVRAVFLCCRPPRD